MYLYTVSLVYWQLLLYGVHVGHSFVNSIIFSAWLVYSYRQNILIINLFKTVLLFKNGYVGLNAACHFSGPIWFVNLHRSVELFVNYSAKQCGEFCYSTYWIHGLISNWITLANTFKKLGRMVRNSNKGQFAKLEMDSTPLILGRFSWPRASFISSVFTSPHPTKESLYLGIPCLAIVDTNVSGHIANNAIPGNDDSLDCIVFYNTHISQYILEKKYGNVAGWFFHIRKKFRTLKFFDWVFATHIDNNGGLNETEIMNYEKKKRTSQENIKENIKFKSSWNSIWTYGLDFFFAKNTGLNNSKEQVDLYEPEDVFSGFDVEVFFTRLRKVSLYLMKIINYYIIKASWRFNRFIKRNTLKEKLFRKRFLIGVYEEVRFWDITDSRNYMKARFYVNRIYKTHLRRNRLRFNKFILKFLKFHFIRKYMNCRGFLSLYSSNLMRVSGLAYISISYGSRLFITDLFTPLLEFGNHVTSTIKILKKDILYKWSFFKRGIKKYISSILSKGRVNKYYKFALKWKIYLFLKDILRSQLYSFYMSYNSFFNFFYWNRCVHNQNRREYNKHCLKIWRVLKLIKRNYLYIKFLQKANNSLRVFAESNFKTANAVFTKDNPFLIYFFKSAIKDYTRHFFLDLRRYYFHRLLRYSANFRRALRKNVKTRKKIMEKIRKYAEPPFRYIKHSKNYKGKKPLRKIRIPGPWTFPGRILKYFRYRRNRYFKTYTRRRLIKSPEIKFARLFEFIINLRGYNKKFWKVVYLLSNYWNAIEFRFPQNFNKYNLSYSSSNKILDVLKYSSTNKFLNLTFDNYFLLKYAKSVYRFNVLINRYFVNYYFRWEELKEQDVWKIKELKKEFKNISSPNYMGDIDYEELKERIDRKLNYIRLRMKSYRVYKKYKAVSKGVSNYLLLGDNNLRTVFKDRYWLYIKKNFYYPTFFYLKNISRNFKLLKPRHYTYLSVRLIKSKKKMKVSRFIFLHHYFRIISLYNRYFYSSTGKIYPYYKRLFSKYENLKKKIFWM
jgi:small subunit ribosomal protein S2